MKKKTNLVLIILWMIFIFVMSSFNANESANQSNIIVHFISQLFNINNLELLSFIVRKIAHFSEYLILGILIYNYCLRLNLSALFCLLYAISDEIHQIFIPGRSCQIRDIIIDLLGAIFGIIILHLYNKRKRRKTKK